MGNLVTQGLLRSIWLHYRKDHSESLCGHNMPVRVRIRHAASYIARGLGMHPRFLACITFVVCHWQLGAQAPQVVLTNELSSAQQAESGTREDPGTLALDALPDDPGQELIPVALPEPMPATGTPVEWEAKRQVWTGDTLTLTGDAVGHYQGYVIRADNVTYNQKTTELHGDGHLQITGGPSDVLINATQGDMRLNMHTARFYNVNGSQGVRTMGRTTVYSTSNPLLFSGRVLLELSEGSYRIIDGSITNCRLPHPDWRIIAYSINLNGDKASMSNAFFEFLGLPIFYLPYLHHPANETRRASGLLIPVISNGSSIRGYTFGEQVYWAISRNMDLVVGSEYYSKRGWSPNGIFRYKGEGFGHLIVRWNALLDRGIEESTSTGTTLVDQGGVDIVAEGSKNLTTETRVAGTMEYLSSYVYRLVFNDNYASATSSQVASNVALTHEHNGFIPSVSLQRFETYSNAISSIEEVRIVHLPSMRYDILDRPLGNSLLYWRLGSSLSYLSRSEPFFHSRNVVRMDFYPHLSMPFSAGGWSFVPEAALRDTAYTISQIPNLAAERFPIPTISHDPLNRHDLEASVDVRPPSLERDFTLPFLNRQLRHLIEPELNYRYVAGIGEQAQNVLLFDSADTVTNVNEAGFSLTQRFYLRSLGMRSCSNEGQGEPQGPQDERAARRANDTGTTRSSSVPPHEWASWQIAQEYFIDANFGGALIPRRRNVFEATQDLMAATFVTSPRNIAPISSRMRFEAINNLNVEWDLDYDTIRGDFATNNLFAGYSFGRTTLGVSHVLLNAVGEYTSGSAAPTTLKSQQLQPYLQIGKATNRGFNLAVNGSYDYVQHQAQYAGVEAVYNWDCCGLMLGYRRFELGTLGTTGRDETQWLYSFTLANFGSVGDIHRADSLFH